MLTGAPLPPGAVVAERYRVVRTVGRGGTATVYEVQRVDLGAPRALKVLHTTGDELRARVRREGRVMASLFHPHLVYVEDLVEVDGWPALVMPFIQGPTLSAVLRHGPMSLDRVFRVGVQLLRALGVAHAAGVLHRDLKPHNVLFDTAAGRDHVRVCDFGLAKASQLPDQELTTRYGAVMGTPAYMAPEQLSGLVHVDARGDLYAAGAVLYEMVTGQRAFTGPTTEAVVEAVRAGAYTPVEHLRPEAPPSLLRAITAALSPKRRDRPPSAEAFANMIQDRLVIRVAPTQVPPILSTAIGVSAAVDHALDHLRRHRLATLHGPGGVGKSRIAADVARRAASARPGGVWWIPPDEITDRGLVRSIAAHVGAPADTVSQLVQWLRYRPPVLVVIDDAEVVVAELRELLPHLLGPCPGLAVLVTSQVPVGLPIEWRIPVEPLETTDGVELLQRRWEAAGGRPTDDPALADIVRTVGGLAGALVLIAPSLRRSPPAEVLRRLRADPLDLRRPRRFSGPPRQASLRGAWEHATSLLTEDLRSAARGLSVFRGAFTRELAERVLAAPPPLEHLVDHALIRVDASANGTRYRWYPTLRWFAAASMDGLPKRRAHLTRRYRAAVLGSVEATGADDARPGRLAGAADRVDARAVLEEALSDGRADDAAAACMLWGWHAAFEGPLDAIEPAVQRVLDLPRVSPAAAARLHRLVGLAKRATGSPSAARERATMARSAAELAGDERAVFFADLDLGEAERRCGRHTAAAEALDRAAAWAARNPLLPIDHWSSLSSGRLAADRGDLAGATRALKSASAMAAQARDVCCRVAVLIELGRLRVAVARPTGARMTLHRAHDLAQEHRDRRSAASALHLLARHHRWRDLDEARPMLARALDLADRIGASELASEARSLAAWMALRAGDVAEGAAELERIGDHGSLRTAIRVAMASAQVAAAQGHLVHARERATAALAMAAPLALLRIEASCVAALVEAAAGSVAAAVRHVRSAEHALAAMGARPASGLALCVADAAARITA